MPGTLLDSTAMACRAAQELFPGAVVALGMGLPGYIPSEVPTGGVWFIADSACWVTTALTWTRMH
ncbi:MAG: hypothetical protein Ct9H300mP11_21420 [Chloroflexota bacterium]|nr:MAG: hypothetical protein Ct9H300mP11_21420 [Chloroflexota bacterium]